MIWMLVQLALWLAVYALIVVAACAVIFVPPILLYRRVRRLAS